MLRVDASAQKRFVLFGVVMLLFLCGTMISGIIQRFNPTESPDAEIDPKIALRIHKQAEKREILYISAETLVQNDRWQDALKLIDSEDNDEAFPVLTHGEVAIRAGNIEQGRKDFLSLIQGDDPVAHATRLMLDGKTEEYRRFCEKTIADISPEKVDALTANNNAWTCVLEPNALTDYTKAIALAQKGANEARPEDKANNLNTLGVLQYRAGKPLDAIKTLTEADSIHKEPFNWPFLAMAYNDTGNPAKAKEYLENLRTHLTRTFLRPSESSRNELVLFFYEAEKVIGSSPTKPVPEVAVR